MSIVRFLKAELKANTEALATNNPSFIVIIYTGFRYRSTYRYRITYTYHIGYRYRIAYRNRIELVSSFDIPDDFQSLKAELKAKTEALATNERQRVQYEAIANNKQQVRPRATIWVQWST